MDEVRSLNAVTTGVLLARITSGLSATSSLTYSSISSRLPFDQRYITRMFWPSFQPSSAKPCWKARIRGWFSPEFSVPAINTPTVGIPACCARVVVGQAAAAVPSQPMNSRRLISLPLTGIQPSALARWEHALDLLDHGIPESLHLRQRGGCIRPPAEIDVDRRDADLLQRAEVGDDVGFAAREQPPLAVRGFRRHSLTVALDAKAHTHRRRLAARLGDGLAQAADAGLEARQRVEQVLVVGADRIPGIADARGAAQRRSRLAADPDRQGLLHRLGLQHDAVELGVAALEARRGLAPQHAEGVDVLVGHRAAFLERRRHHGVELGLQPAGADADDQPSARQHVE